MRETVRKQSITLVFAILAGIASASIGSLAQSALHVDGYFVFTALFGILLFVVLRFGPDGWRGRDHNS